VKEGSLDKPIRHPLDWQNSDFYDTAKIDEEFRRASDICHGCRRCFNLCDAFPRLFDLIDQTPEEAIEAVSSEDLAQVADACTLCDMCFMTKCPYVPPHEFDLDFPHLMLRYKAAQLRNHQVPRATQELTKVDRNSAIATKIAPLVNWVTDRQNKPVRAVIQAALGIDARAEVPKFQRETLMMRTARDAIVPNPKGPAQAEKFVIFATCYCNYNNTNIGVAAQRVLAHMGAMVATTYPECCGMPQLEHGDIAAVAAKAERVAIAMNTWLDQGYKVVALVPSCALMIKFEWPLIWPQNSLVQRLAAHTVDISEAVVALHKTYGNAPGLHPLANRAVTVHIACHARAQNMGRKAAEMLRLIPETHVDVIERCSGHGGTWGMSVDHFQLALKVGRPVVRQARRLGNTQMVSECPLAGIHINQGLKMSATSQNIEVVGHPIELLAQAYGLSD
jgi:glycerol-3-phosphate dehydrogenase subunit C